MGKRKQYAYIITIFLLILTLILTNAYSASVYLQAQPVQTASVRLIVVDGRENTPIHNACVCIPEAGAYFYTDNNGNTPLIEVPVIPDSNYDGIVKRDFGEVTALVYKDGYIDYILLNLAVKQNETRQGIKIMMYKTEEDSPQYISIVETPDGGWIEQIIKKYKK